MAALNEPKDATMTETYAAAANAKHDDELMSTSSDLLDTTLPAVGQLRPDEAAAGGLGRHLGLLSTTALIIGRIIGVGIFSTPSSITQAVGSVGAALMLWVAGLIISFAGLFIWLELGCMIPRSGGEKVYLEAAYKRPKLLATVIFAVQAILLGFTASGCIVFSTYIFAAAGGSPSEWEKRGIAIAVLSFITLVHVFVPRVGVRAMDVIVFIKIFTLLFIVVTGWVVLGGGVKSIPDPNASFRNAFAGSSSSGYEYATALFDVLNSYTGWSNAAYVLNEVRNPVRTLKIAGPLGLGTCGVFYLLAIVAYYSAGSAHDIIHSGTTVVTFFMDRVFGTAAAKAFSVLVAISAFGNVMTITFAQSRVNQELAKEGVIPFPKFWASGWPFGSPSAGLLLHYIPSFIIIVAVPFDEAYSFILDLEGYPSSIINLFVTIGFFWLRYAEPDLPRPFRCWLPIAVFYTAAQGFLVVAPFLKPPGGGSGNIPYWLYPVVGIAILAAGFFYWLFQFQVLPYLGRYELEPTHHKLQDGTRVIVYEKVKAA